MRIHILGICGTFMGGLAMLARQLGHEVTGSDANVYPPMSTLLEKQGIELIQGYDASQLEPQPDRSRHLSLRLRGCSFCAASAISFRKSRFR